MLCIIKCARYLTDLVWAGGISRHAESKETIMGYAMAARTQGGPEVIHRIEIGEITPAQTRSVRYRAHLMMHSIWRTC